MYGFCPIIEEGEENTQSEVSEKQIRCDEHRKRDDENHL
jgi:hypothetical protein